MSARRKSLTHALSVSPVPHTCTGLPRATPPLANRKCTLHARNCSNEHLSCVRVDCCGYCLHRYSGCDSLPAVKPSCSGHKSMN